MIAPLDTNSNNQSTVIREIQELSIAISAKNLNPAMLSVDFLKFSGIVPNEWELNNQPVMNPNFSQISFQNGVSIVAQPRTITFIEVISQANQTVKLPEIIHKYVDKLPLAEYQGVSISPKSVIPLPGEGDAARNYITRTLLSQGPWQEFGVAPVQANINYLYQLEKCQLSLGVNEARLQLPDQRSIPAILFAGSFNYNFPNTGDFDRLSLLKQAVDEWQSDLASFREIVNQRFMAQQASVFPTNTIPSAPEGGL